MHSENKSKEDIVQAKLQQQACIARDKERERVWSENRWLRRTLLTIAQEILLIVVQEVTTIIQPSLIVAQEVMSLS